MKTFVPFMSVNTFLHACAQLIVYVSVLLIIWYTSNYEYILKLKYSSKETNELRKITL